MHRVLARHPKAREAAPTLSPANTTLDEGAGAQKPILCAACAAAITNSAHRMAIAGSHDHRFMNPGGFTFHLGCFDAALGCTIVGPESVEYPWFPGYSWRYALCGACGRHLGWHFRKPEHAGFFGLVLDRLRESSTDA